VLRSADRPVHEKRKVRAGVHLVGGAARYVGQMAPEPVLVRTVDR
jgi:hypothetical protein